MRSLRTSLLTADADTPPQVIVMTSSIPGEGKTTNSLALALNLVGLGRKVIILEGDFRRRVFGQYFDGLPEDGLANILSGKAELADVVQQPKDFGADVVVGGHSRTNPADLFSSEAFDRLIDHLRSTYDYVIIDAPPVLAVPDARIIAMKADAVILSVKWNSTTKTQLNETLRLMRGAASRNFGLVLSQVSPRGMRRYGYGDRYGAYSNYGSNYYSG